MANNIAIYNFKGGVGKTTTTFNVGSNWSQSFKVLLIDFDPQCNLTDTLIHEKPKETIYYYTKCLLHDQPIHISPIEITPYLHIVPGDYQMVNAESNNQFITFGPEMLHRLLTPLQREYDIILMDCPTNFGVLVRSIFQNIDHILIPTIPDSFSASGVKTLVNYLSTLKTDKHLKILGILFNMYRRELHQNREAFEKAQALFGNMILKTTISSSFHVREAINMGKSIQQLIPDHHVAKDFRKLCDELLEKLHENKTVQHLQEQLHSRLSA